MKIYTAAAWGRRAEIKKIAAELEKLGVTITARWLNEPLQPKGSSVRKWRRETAMIDIDDIKVADILVRFSDAETMHKHKKVDKALLSGARLFETDPSGALIEYRASAVGAGRTQALEVLEKDYKDGMTEEAAIQLGLKALHAGTEGKFNPDALEIAAVTASPSQGLGGFRLLSADEVKAAVKAAAGGKE